MPTPDHDAQADFSVFVHLPAYLNVEDYERAFSAGVEPDASPYGFHHAREAGVDVRFSRRPASHGGRIERIVTRVLGFNLLHSFRNRADMAAADAIWTMIDGEALGPALLMKIGLLNRKPIIASVVWLINNWSRMPALKRFFYRWLLTEIRVLLVHSKECLPGIREIAPTVKSDLLYYGISTDVFSTSEAPGQDNLGETIRIVAAGNDRTRDWATLIEAFCNVPGVHLSIACRWLPPEATRGADNIDRLELSGTAALADHYRRADIVAVPMVENLFSGITVALEAAAVGTPVLSSRTGGVPTYLAEDEAFYAPVGDAAAMRAVVLATSRKERREVGVRARRRFEEYDYSSRAMALRYTRITRDVLAEVYPDKYR